MRRSERGEYLLAKHALDYTVRVRSHPTRWWPLRKWRWELWRGNSVVDEAWARSEHAARREALAAMEWDLRRRYPRESTDYTLDGQTLHEQVEAEQRR